LNEILLREGRGSRDRRKGQGRWTRRRWICGRREGLGDESGRCGELVEKDGDRGAAGMFYGREGHGRGEPRRRGGGGGCMRVRTLQARKAKKGRV
jgi:hypothetical protein